MRRTWKKSVSPTIGIVVDGTGKIGFGPACAAAGPGSAIAALTAAPAAAAKRSRRDVFLMMKLLNGAPHTCVRSQIGLTVREDNRGSGSCARAFEISASNSL